MSFRDNYIGCPCGVSELRALNDELNAKVLERVNSTQELLMINDFAKDANEFMFKKCLQDRISDICSWRWVLEDLTKRLDAAICSLKYELKALNVVRQRVQKEIQNHCKERAKPVDLLCPRSDYVEDAINTECAFLHEQKKNFEGLIVTLEKQIASLNKTNKKIMKDILLKSQTIEIEESCAKIDINNVGDCNVNMKRKKGSPLKRWQNKCCALKREGLNALCHAVCTRQQVRGARVQLSIISDAHMAKVDTALRRRLHANKAKYAELEWQKEEAATDLRVLDAEMLSTEQTLLKNMEQERVVKARFADRATRPPGELIKDDVNIKLKDELVRIKRFIKDLRKNLDSISALQTKLKDSILRIECAQKDLQQIISMDEERMAMRMGLVNNVDSNLTSDSPPPTECAMQTIGMEPACTAADLPPDCDRQTIGMEPPCTAADLPPEARCSVLLTIQEEDEDVIEEEESSNEEVEEECCSGEDNFCNVPEVCCNEEVCFNEQEICRNVEENCNVEVIEDDDDVDDYPFDY